jgi:glutathione synthase
MSLAVAIQMDPVSTIDIKGDSTFVLALEAQRRGHGLFHYLPQDLSLIDGRLIANMRPVVFQRDPETPATLGSPQRIDLATLDIVLMRQDPPFDMAYVTATHLLEHVHPETLVVNDPMEVRNAPEKLFVTHFADLLPPTLISRSRKDIADFRAEHRDIIIKPLYGNAGAGVFHLKPEDENLTALLEMFEAANREPWVIQKYLPEVRQGRTGNEIGPDTPGDRNLPGHRSDPEGAGPAVRRYRRHRRLPYRGQCDFTNGFAGNQCL